MTEFTNAFLLVYAGLFPILNPVGSAFILLCIGIQVLWTGFSTLVLPPPSS